MTAPIPSWGRTTGVTPGWNGNTECMANEPELQPDEVERKKASVLSEREAISLISSDEKPADPPEEADALKEDPPGGASFLARQAIQPAPRRVRDPERVTCHTCAGDHHGPDGTDRLHDPVRRRVDPQNAVEEGIAAEIVFEGRCGHPDTAACRADVDATGADLDRRLDRSR